MRNAKRPWITASLAGAVMAFALGTSTPAVAADEAAKPTDTWNIARGAQLYDNWMSVLEADAPTETHKAWPASNTKKKGATTWRCKSCHGWDYKGKDGAYATGSYKTGIKGVRGVVGMEVEKIQQIIMNDTHGYTSDMFTHSAVEKLVLFLSRGQVDTDRYIDRASKVVRGNPRRGARYYQTICAVCHGFDGRDINFDDADNPEYVGTVCAKNPWEALHKIRFGQPGVGMVAMTVLPMDDIVDIAAYCQGLPIE